MLSDKDEKTLQEIVDLDGKCLESKRCHECPFRAICLPEFLHPTPPTQPQRLKMALDVLAFQSILEDEIDMDGVQSSYGWGKHAKRKSKNGESK